MKSRKTGQLMLTPDRRERAGLDDDIARLLYRAQRTIRRAEAVLALTREPGAEKDILSKELVQHQAIAMIADLQNLCLCMERSRKDLAETLALTTQFQAARSAYRQAKDKKELR